VRESAPVTTKPWNSPAATLAAPKPTSSRFGSTCSPVRAAKLRAVTMPLEKLTTSTPAAPSRMLSTPSSRTGRRSAGRPAGTSPTTAMPRLGKSNSHDSRQAPTTSMIGPGQVGRQRLIATSSRHDASPRHSVGMRISDTRRDSSRNGCTSPLLRRPTPVRPLSCDSASVTATPAM
jgi:hypothetical protein